MHMYTYKQAHIHRHGVLRRRGLVELHKEKAQAARKHVSQISAAARVSVEIFARSQCLPHGSETAEFAVDKKTPISAQSWRLVSDTSLFSLSSFSGVTSRDRSLERRITTYLRAVSDFGFAQYLSNSEHKFTIRGSPLYMAPEMLLKHKYDARVDLWSVGVIMYECLFGKAPYSSSSFQELAEKIKDSRPIEVIPRC